jgi:hypothetical protein
MTKEERKIELIKLIQEYEMCTGIHESTKDFVDTRLPDPNRLKIPSVQLLRRDLVRFRNNYAMLLDFAALVLNKDPKDICPLDFIAPFIKQPSEDDLWPIE